MYTVFGPNTGEKMPIRQTRYDAQAPNGLWCADYKGKFMLGKQCKRALTPFSPKMHTSH